MTIFKSFPLTYGDLQILYHAYLFDKKNNKIFNSFILYYPTGTPNKYGTSNTGAERERTSKREIFLRLVFDVSEQRLK